MSLAPMRTFFSFLLFCFFLHLKSQTSPQTAFQNYAISQHYDLSELVNVHQTDSITFNTIVYYYTQSYLFEPMLCNCAAQTAETFDIAQYEYLRKRNVRFERYFEKYGFKLTLLSINELQYKLPIHTP